MEVRLHSIVIPIGSSIKQSVYIANKNFPDYEIVSYEKIKYDLYGDKYKLDVDTAVFDEMCTRISSKLSIGERVVLIIDFLSDDNKKAIRDLAKKFSVPLYFITQNKNITVKGGIVENEFIVDGSENFIVIKKFSTENMMFKFKGVCIIGDVHGVYEDMEKKIIEAQKAKQFIVLLGDIIDYGSNSLKCIDLVYELMVSGKAWAIKGNHERKIHRWIQKKNDVTLSEGNKTTITELNALSKKDKDAWIIRFNAVVNLSDLVLRLMPDTYLAHAAIHPTFWNSKKDKKSIEIYALFGENKAGNRSYEWVNDVPKDTTVIVGHDILSTENTTTKTNEYNGVVRFIDTGSGKGGKLSQYTIKW